MIDNYENIQHIKSKATTGFIPQCAQHAFDVSHIIAKTTRLMGEPPRIYAIIPLDISAIMAYNIDVNYSYNQIEKALKLLDGRLMLNDSPGFSLIVCGGAALNAMNLIRRTTKDVDIVALMDSESRLVDPAPLPEELMLAAKEVADTLNLPEDWLNNGPSSGDGGLFRLGLPDGFSSRLIKSFQGQKLTVYFTSRLDQIHFKLYAAVDQYGGYHASDLKELDPANDELLQAINWVVRHDSSEGFKMAIRLFLKEFGYEQLAEKI